MKMTLTFLAILLVIMAAYLVIENRDSEKLVSNFLSVLILGSLGLLITSFLSLRDENIKDKFSANIFIGINPVELPMISNFKINKGRNTPIIFTEDALRRCQAEEECNKNLKLKIENNYNEFLNDITIRYILDLLVAKYEGHWYYESIDIKTPSGHIGNSRPIDNSVGKKFLTWKSIANQNLKNNLLKIGHSIEEDRKNSREVGIMVPKETTLQIRTNNRGFEIKMSNKFIELTLDFDFIPSISSVNDLDVLNVFQINEKEKSNFRFHTFVVKSNILKKRFKSGNPKMIENEYWAKDIVNYLKNNISTDEFWRIIDLNK